jgi:LemA protein
MEPSTIILIVIAVLVVIIILWLFGTYNKFIKLRNRVDNAWAQIDVQLQRRNDLIPNLVETVKGYAAHESGTLARVTEARSAVMSAETPAESAAADNMLSGALKSLFAVAENYPDLKANTSFLDLQTQLRDTEDKIMYMRQSFNDTVMFYNNAIQVAPASIVAGIFKFTERELFIVAEGAATVPNVKF